MATIIISETVRPPAHPFYGDSWVNPDPYNPIVRFLYGITEPVFAFVRRYLPILPMGLDLSPLIVLLAIVFLQQFLVKTLIQLAEALR